MFIGSTAMEAKPSEPTDVTQSGSQQDAQQQTVQPTSVCLFFCLYVLGSE